MLVMLQRLPVMTGFAQLYQAPVTRLAQFHTIQFGILWVRSISSPPPVFRSRRHSVVVRTVAEILVAQWYGTIK